MPTQKRDREDEKKSLTGKDGKETKMNSGSKSNTITGSKTGSQAKAQQETEGRTMRTAQQEENQDEPKRRNR